MLDELAQHAAVDIVELLYIEAAHAALVLAESCNELLVLQGGPEINDERGCARREACDTDFAFVPARVAIMVAAEPDDGGSPHLRRLTGDVLHQRDELMTVLALALICDFVDELQRIDLGGLRLRFVFRHQRGSASLAASQLFAVLTARESEAAPGIAASSAYARRARAESPAAAAAVPRPSSDGVRFG